MRLGLITITLGLFLSTIGLFASSGTNENLNLTSQEREWISKHSPIRVGLSTAWAPFSYLDKTGKETGIDVDILNIISRRTGLKFALVPAASWAEVVSQGPQGKRDKWDITASTTQTAYREKAFRFTEPYLTAQSIIVAREGDHRFTHIALLRDATVAMPRKNFTTIALAHRLPLTKIILTNTESECFEMVRRGQADATIANVYFTGFYLNQHPGTKIGISGIVPEFASPLRFMVREDYAPLVDILNKALATISQDERDEVASRHLRFDLQGGRRVALLKHWIARILAGATLIAILFLIWNFSLRREIRRRRIVETELHEANESIDVFAHSLSHDLRGPLRSISGYAEALQEDCAEQLNPNGQNYVSRILASASRMNNLIRSVLDYGRASHSESPLETVSLETLVLQLIDEFPKEQRGCFHLASALPAVQGNPILLAQCLGNLLTNAIKFVPSDRTPKIDIRAEEGGSFIKVWVEDNGIGIAPKDQQRIFKMFERVAPPDFKGTGIGLAVVAKSMERMGGTVGVESEPGKGSRFWIRLPSTSKSDSVPKPTLLHPFRRRLVAS